MNLKEKLGSGAGVSISPIAFLVVQQNTVKLLPVEHCSSVDRLLDYVPDLMDKLNNFLNKNMQNKKEEKREELKSQERARKELKETLENISETVPTPNNINIKNKTIPRRSKMQKAENMMRQKMKIKNLKNRKCHTGDRCRIWGR